MHSVLPLTQHIHRYYILIICVYIAILYYRHFFIGASNNFISSDEQSGSEANGLKFSLLVNFNEIFYQQ